MEHASFFRLCLMHWPALVSSQHPFTHQRTGSSSGIPPDVLTPRQLTDSLPQKGRGLLKKER
eukprot:3716019-Rhodomonas_salina.1